MIYSADITTPENTTAKKPLVTEVQVTSGFVYKVEFDFPPGSAGLLRCYVKDGGYQVWPGSLGEVFRGDGVLISFEDSYLKLAEPFIFSVHTFNLDDTFEHDLSVRIGLVSQEIFMARYLPTYGYAELQKVIETAYEKQRMEQDAAFTAMGENAFPVR